MVSITTSLSDHGCAWPASRSYDRDRFALPVRFGAVAAEGGRPNQAVALMIPTTKHHPGTLVWSPPT